MSFSPIEYSASLRIGTVEFVMADLRKVANVEKKMPTSYISRDGFGISARCRQYLAPLIKGESYPPYRNGLPQYVTLKNVAVAKKLQKTFKV